MGGIVAVAQKRLTAAAVGIFEEVLDLLVTVEHRHRKRALTACLRCSKAMGPLRWAYLAPGESPCTGFIAGSHQTTNDGTGSTWPSASPVVLGLYGIEVLGKLWGEFAVGSLEHGNSPARPRRDLAGARPLFLRQHKGMIAVASGSGALARLDGGVPTELVPEELLGLAADATDRHIEIAIP